MRLTPWTLTVATFLMVGAIALTYFFKHSPLSTIGQRTVPVRRVYVHKDDSSTTPNAKLNPQSSSDSSGDRVSNPPAADSTATLVQRPVYTPGVDFPVSDEVDSSWIDKSPGDVHTDQVTPGTASLPLVVGSDLTEPDGLFEETVTDVPPIPRTTASSEEQPEPPKTPSDKPGFVTQQYRSTTRMDVRFVDGKRLTPRVTEVALPANQRN